MSKNASPININILDKDYLVTCEQEESDMLRRSADYLNEKMLELKKSGMVIGSERIAVMAALNITNEFLTYKQENQDYTVKVDSTIKHLQDRIDDALFKNEPSI